MLYLIATPIGNLSDITFRAIETLKKVDYVLCEDTRKSGILLKHYGIKKSLKSFHSFNEKKSEGSILRDLKEGKSIALLSDAGTPGISDPGQALVDRCNQEKISVTSLPGSCSPIVALSLSGLSTDRFQFLGFVPKGVKERRNILMGAFFYPGISIFFESPQRILKTLEELDQMGPEHEIALVREISKIHEECLRGKSRDFLKTSFRGEIILLIKGFREIQWDISLLNQVKQLQKEFQLDQQEAIKIVAQLRKLPKNAVYSCVISGKKI